MKLAPAFDDAVSDARAKVRGAVGVAVLTCIEAMGYTVVPTNLVEWFRKTLEKDDDKRASEPTRSDTR